MSIDVYSIPSHDILTASFRHICTSDVFLKILEVIWANSKLSKHINSKFNNKGVAICTKKDNTYDKICFTKPFDYELFVQGVKNNDIYFDSGMYDGNTRNYSQFRADKKYWNTLICEEY